MNRRIWDEKGRELFKTELGRVEMAERKVQEILGELGTRMREYGKGREKIQGEKEKNEKMMG